MGDDGPDRIRLISLALVAMMLLVPLTYVGGNAVVGGASPDVQKNSATSLGLVSSQSSFHPPIRIDSNSELVSAAAANGWSGSGTASDPYVIDGLTMAAAGDTNSISVGNVSLYLRISNCTVSNLRPFTGGVGISVTNVANATIRDNVVSFYWVDILLTDSSSITLANNSIDHGLYGIQLDASDRNLVERNHFEICYLASVEVDDSADNVVRANTLHNTSDIHLMYSSNNLIEDNVLSESSINQIHLYYSDHNVVRNNTLDHAEVLLSSSSDIVVEGNSFHGDFGGIELLVGNDNCTLINNQISDGNGIEVTQSNEEIIAGNTLINCDLWGISLEMSSHNSLWNNTLVNSSIYINRDWTTFTNQTIYTNNTVNGGPVYYIKNADMGNSSMPSDAGEIILANVTRAVVRDMHLGNQHFGLQMGFCSYILVENNVINNVSDCGIFTTYSWRIVIRGNTITGGWEGILVDSGHNMTLENNTVINTIGYGIEVNYCLDDSLSDNNLIGCSISLGGSWLGLSPGDDQFIYQRQDISTSNTVNGKPVYYYKNADMHGASVPAGAGQVLLVNIKNMVVEGQEFKDQTLGLMTSFCNGITIQDNLFENESRDTGIWDSKSCVVQRNTFVGNYLGYTSYDGGLFMTGRPLVSGMSSASNIIRNNTFTDTSGIYMTGYNIVIEDNSLLSCGGIDAAGSNNLVQRNVLENGTSGIGANDGGYYIGMVYTNDTLRDNRVTNCGYAGMTLSGCSNSHVVDNLITDCPRGIWLERGAWMDTNDNTLTGNTMVNCSLVIEGDFDMFTTQTITTDNTVNGRPVCYYANGNFGNATVPTNAGEAIVANARYLTLRNLNLSDQSVGALVAYSDHIMVEDSAFWDCSQAGVRLYESSHCVVTGNTISDCADGLLVDASTANELTWNTISRGGLGIELTKSLWGSGPPNGNRLENNSFSAAKAVRLDTAQDTALRNNTIADSPGVGIDIYDSDRTTIEYNIILDSASYGIYDEYSGGGTIAFNILVGNNGAGSTFDPAHDQGYESGYIPWNTTNALGNYWGDWLTPDLNHDGIVDQSYPLDGAGLSADEHPLAYYVGVPYGLRARAGIGFVQLDWTGVNYTLVGPLTSYALFRQTAEGTTSIALPPDARHCNDSSVEALHDYSYWLVARAGPEQSGPSGEVRALVPYNGVPTLTITSPASGALVNHSSVWVSWTAEDLVSGIAYCHVLLNQGEWQNASAGLDWTFTGLIDGTNTVSVMAFNHAGASNIATVSFTVDTTAPTVIEHSWSQATDPIWLTVTVTFSEPMNTSSTIVSIPGITGFITWEGNIAIWKSAYMANPGASYTVMVSGADLAGNHLATNWDFTAPSEPAPSPFDWWWLILIIILIAIATYVEERRRRRKKREREGNK
jgi:parallel beta-helix repeat protein